MGLELSRRWGLSGRIWRVGQRPGMRDLSHRIVRELVVQRPGMRGGGAVRLVDVGAGAYVAARRDTRTDGPCGVGRRTGHSGGVDAVRAILAGDGSGGSGGGGASL